MPDEKPTPAQELAAQYGDGDEVAQAPPAADSPPGDTPPLNAAGRPYDPATGRLLPLEQPAVGAERPADSPPEVPPAPHLAPYLVRMAEDFGIPTDGMTDESLAAAVRAVQRTVLQARSENDALQSHQQQPAPASAAQAPPADDFDLGLSPEESEQIHPDVAKILKKALARAVGPLQRRVEELSRREVTRATETNTERIDRAFAGLNDPRLGTASRAELADDAPEVARRQAVVQQAARLAGPKATVAQVCAQLKKARDLLYEPPAAPASKPAPKPKGVSPEEWEQGGTARPTQRQGSPEPNGKSKAERSVGALLDEMRGAENTPPEVTDDFPW